jgi:hypothetical protein
MSISALSKHQWFKVLKVLFWLLLSVLISLVPAYITHHYAWLDATPAVNFVLYSLSQLFKNDVTVSEAQLSTTIQPLVGQAVVQVEQHETPISPPSSATPPSVPLYQG